MFPLHCHQLRIYDCQIAPYATDERDLAKLHMARLKELRLGGSLLLLDRWYPSKQFLAYTLDAGFSFVMRVRKKWNLDVDAVDEDDWVTLRQDGRTLRIRVIKAALPSGEIETLLTNFTEEQLPAAEAGELYFKRWGFEKRRPITWLLFNLPVLLLSGVSLFRSIANFGSPGQIYADRNWQGKQNAAHHIKNTSVYDDCDPF